MRLRPGIPALCTTFFLLILTIASNAPAQTDLEVNAAVELDFSTPGARSLGLGGAFVALADDATAAFTNPAGLLQLSHPEIAVEGRRRVFTTTFTDRGNTGTPTGLGVDGFSGLIEGTATSDINNVSFLSFVYPKKKWAVAVYRHELANFATRFETEGAFLGQDTLRLLPVRTSLDLEIENLGVAVGFRVGKKLSLGLGISSYEFRLTSRTDRFDLLVIPQPEIFIEELLPGGIFGAPDFSDQNLASSQVLDGDDDDISFNAGLLWTINGKVSLGASYRRGASFDLLGSSFGSSPNDQIFFSAADFNVPDVISIGFAFKALEAMTVAVEYDRVTYSDLTQSVPVLISSSDVVDNLVADDADELHIGFEYLFLTKNPVGIRFGAWHDPDHKTRFGLDEPILDDARAGAALFRPGDDIVHYTFGVGISVGKNFQIDAGLDLSERVDTGSLSAVFRF